MYKEVKIHQLSPTQHRNLLKGCAVRIKKGGALSVHLSPEQLKKIDRASAKDRAVQIMFDPYQIQMHGGSFKGDMENFYNKHIPQSFHPGLESLGKATLGELGFGLKKRGRPKKKGGSLKSEMEKFYNEKIPHSFHPGLESLGKATLGELGFGLKKRGRPRKKKGGDLMGDISNIGRNMMNTNEGKFAKEQFDRSGYGQALNDPRFQELSRMTGLGMKGKGGFEDWLRGGYEAATHGLADNGPAIMNALKPSYADAIADGVPGFRQAFGGKMRKTRGKGFFEDVGKFAGRTLQQAAPILKPMAKQVAKEIVKYGAKAAGPAAAGAAVASGNPELAPLALIAGEMLASQGASTANKYIEGLGIKTMGKPYGRRSRKMHGKALMPAGY